jgi:hypothetical protein
MIEPEVLAAITLLRGLHHRGRVEEGERFPAWQAIKLLYRAGVSREMCEHLVEGVRRLGVKNTFGPTLLYYLEIIRVRLERGEAV